MLVSRALRSIAATALLLCTALGFAAPTVTSIVLVDAPTTNGVVLNFDVTFSEPVAGVADTNFITSGTGVSATVGTPTSSDQITWTVPVTSVSGNGTLGIQLNDGTGITAISDSSTLTGTPYDSPAYTVDQTAPQILAFTITDITPTSASLVNFTFQVDEAISGLSTANFSLTGSGASGTIGAPTTTDSLTWIIPVSSVSGNGTLGLQFSNSTGATDAAGNEVAGSPADSNTTYTIDQTPPAVLSITRADTNPTSASTVNFVATFSEPVSGVVLSSFTPAATGTAAGTVSSATTSDGGLTWLITLTSVSGDGNLGVDLTDVSGISDAAGNPLAAGATGQTYLIDTTAPAVVSILRADANPTSSTVVHFTVNFGEPVTTPTAGNFAFSGGGVTASVGAITSSDQQTFDVSVTVFGTGTLGLDLVDGIGITDAANNPLAGLPAIGELYDVDQSGPQVLSITRIDADPTSATLLRWLVTFDSAATGLTTSSFSLVTAGVTGTLDDASTTDGGFTWTVSAINISGTGTARLDFADTSGVSDAVGNPVTNVPFAGDTYTIDQTNPVISSIVATDVSPTSATTVKYTVTFTEKVTGVTSASFTLNLSGVNATIGDPVDVSGGVWTVPVLLITGDGTLRLDLTDPTGIYDLVGNPLTGAPFTGEVYTIDQMPPTVLSITRAAANPTSASSLPFTVVFSEPVTTLTAANLALSGTGVIGSFGAITTADNVTFTVAVDSVAGSGTLGIDVVNSNGVEDLAGNALAGLPATGEQYDVDQGSPVALSLLRADANPTSATTLNFTLKFSEPVINVTSAALALTGSGVSGAINDPTSTDSITWYIAVTAVAGDGLLGVDLVDTNGIQDFQGNGLVAGVTGEQYTVDQTEPVALSLTRADANPTSATTLNFTLTFNEAVTGVTSASLALTGSGVAGVLSDPTTTDGISWNVAVTSVLGSGTLGVDLTTTAGIFDLAWNPLSNGITGELYDVDQNGPVANTLTRTDINPTSATVLNFELLFNEPVTGVTSASLSIAAVGTTGILSDPVTTDGVSWLIQVIGVTGNGTLGVDLTTTAGIMDLAGNPLTDGVVGEFYTVDQTPPTVLSIKRLDPDPTTSSSVRFKLTFSEAVTTLSISNLTTSATGTATGTVTQILDLGGGAYEVTATSSSGQGLFWVGLGNGSGIYDLVGNPYAGPLPFFDEFYTFCAAPGQATTPINPPNGSTQPTTLSSLSWSPGTGAISYNVILDGSPLATTTATTVNIPAQSVGPHTWRVDSDSGCSTTLGADWNFTISALAPVTGPVEPPDGARLCSSPALLSWNAAAGAAQYAIYLDGLLFGNTAATSFAPPPIPQGPHTWRVDALDSSNNSVAGPTWNFVILANGLIDSNVWHTDGQVYAILATQNTIYIAGNFTYVLSPENTTWQPRNYVAAIDTFTGIPTPFDPNANGPVYALAMQGNTLYMGGAFSKVTNVSRQRLAAIDVTSPSAPLDWDPKADATVRALLADSGQLYAGGDFTTIGGQPQAYLAELNTTASAITSWPPVVSNSVYALAAAGSDICIGGIFQSVDTPSKPYHGVAAIDRDSGLSRNWLPGNTGADLYVYALTYTTGRLYCGGEFNTMCGQPRSNLACIDPVNGQLYGWNPTADRYVSCLAIDHDTVFAGGSFTEIGTERHLRLAGIHFMSGAPIGCDYDCNNVVRALGLTQNILFAGGDFTRLFNSNAGGFAALGSKPTNPASVKDWSVY